MIRARNGYLLVAMLLFTIWGCTRDKPRVRIGEPLPGVTLSTLGGERITLPDDLKGNLVIMLFWEKGCPYCAVEMPLAESLYLKYRDRGFVLLAVNVGNEKDEVEEAVSKMEITYPVLLDPKSMTARKFGIRGLPTMYFVNRDGTVGEKILGGVRTDILDSMVSQRL